MECIEEQHPEGVEICTMIKGSAGGNFGCREYPVERKGISLLTQEIRCEEGQVDDL